MLLVFGVLAAGASDAIDTAISHFGAGRFDEGCAVALSAYNRDPASRRVQLAYARCITGGARARQLYHAIASDTTALDSLRAEAWRMLGCYYFISSSWDSAGHAFSSAVRIDPSIRVRHAGGFLMDTIAQRQISFAEIGPEKAHGAAQQPETKMLAVRPSAQRRSEPGYTLQVGAFGTSENARRMLESMKEIFADVTIKTESSGGTTLHKVRVGSFATEQEALSFGEGRLRSRSVPFRVVKE